jgi:tetratricopeptide (TPR) repeat protein
MVKDKGDEGMGYTVAWDKERTTNEAYMKAAGQNGIPCCFVVDGTGTIAWIGHPMHLDLVLEPVLAGKWDVKTGPEAIDKAQKAFSGVFAKSRTDPKAALAEWSTFESEYPKLAKQFRDQKLNIMIQAGEYDAVYKAWGEAFDLAVSKKDAAKLNQIAWTIVNPMSKMERKDLDLALRAATKADEFADGQNSTYLETLSRVYFLRGDTAKAAELEVRTVDTAITKKDSQALNSIAWKIVDPKGTVEVKNLDLAMKAATKADEFTKNEDAAIIDTLARVYFLKGNNAKAVELQTRAVSHAKEPMKADLEKALAEYKEAAKKHD